ncbi:MAG: hypothetical protein ABFS16_14705 [Bacteroidota bacterium]
MNRKYVVYFFIGALIALTSCVSKKKYLEMEAGRLKAEELSRQLDEENNAKAARIEALISDFEAMKNELMESNAIKDDYIDSLKNEMFVLSQDLNKQTKSLEETSFNLDFEKQRLTNTLSSKDKTIGSQQKEIEQLESQMSAKNNVIQQKNFDIGKLTEQAKILEGQIQTGENNLNELQGQLDKSKADVIKLQKEMKEKDATITKLQNNVNLLKKELGK